MQYSFPLKIYPLLLFVVTAPVGAQESVASTASTIDTLPPVPDITPIVPIETQITVDELVQRALANNLQLPVARQTQEAARQRLNATRAFPNPTLELVPRLAGDREAADTEVILSQPLDLFGRRRARAGVARAELRRAQAETTLAERNLIVQVKNSAADLFAAQEAESLGSVQVEVAQLFRDAATRRAQLGDVPPVQVQRAELELLRAQNELTNAQAERLARRAALNQIIAQPPETPLRVALPLSTGLTDVLRLRPAPFRSGASTNIPSEEASSGSAIGATPPIAEGLNSSDVTVSDVTASNEVSSNVSTPGASGTAPLPASSQIGSNMVSLRGQILPNALANRPDVVSAQATLEARRAQVNVIGRERLPNIELQARRSAFFGEEGTYAFRAVVTLPIFDFGSIKGERRAAEAEVRAQEATIALLRTQVATQVEQALIRLQQQRATVERYRTSIVPQTLDLLRKTQIGYASGASTYLEVLEAQRTLRQVQTEYLQALVGTRTSEAALESALGATPSADLLGNVSNPTGPAVLPGTAAPGTVPEGTIPPNTVEPLDPPGAPAINTLPTTSATPDISANLTGDR